MIISIGSLADLVAALDAAKMHKAIADSTIDVSHGNGHAKFPGSNSLIGTATNPEVLKPWAAARLAEIDMCRSPTLFGPYKTIDGLWQVEIISYSTTD